MKRASQQDPASLLSSSEAQKLSQHKDDLQRLAGSKDGQTVKAMLDKDGASLQDAFQRGDMETLQNAVAGILQTDAGARLAQQLSAMLGEK